MSLFFFVLEIVIPWRKGQGVIRKDFWLDAAYMFFNFFIFSLIVYNAASAVIVTLFNDLIIGFSGFDLQASNPLRLMPYWVVLLVGFVIRDFVQWCIHRLLHRISWLWEYHKLHHSVEEMGFAAHLRYHWMETIVYRTLEYLPLALLGIGLYDFFVIHIFTLAWGHFNHSNLTVDGKITGGILGLIIGIVIANGLLEVTLLQDPSSLVQFGSIIVATVMGTILLGPFMKKIFNSPEMHIWHHAYDIPDDKRYGVNFGLTLAVWDYLFSTAYVPFHGRDIKLGFPGFDNYGKNFLKNWGSVLSKGNK